ncbi:transposase [Bradyrhizobium sp.]|uniref:transposase n=1 Tax=Bradyrhizobium sp. TaxID=376 RepID=UPI0025BB5C01|nr:transposase [Bradyrhizobium sp.]
MRRNRFGAKSEKLRPDQYYLPLEDVEIAQGILDAAQERAEAVIKGRSRSVPDQGYSSNLAVRLSRNFHKYICRRCLGARRAGARTRARRARRTADRSGRARDRLKI